MINASPDNYFKIVLNYKQNMITHLTCPVFIELFTWGWLHGSSHYSLIYNIQEYHIS